MGLPCYHVAGAKQSRCTFNEGDPYVAVVQSAYLARRLGGAVHMLAFAFIHGVRTSLVWRAQVTSDDARPCPMKNRVCVCGWVGGWVGVCVRPELGRSAKVAWPFTFHHVSNMP